LSDGSEMSTFQGFTDADMLKLNINVKHALYFVEFFLHEERI